jgi:hypothetical protein
MPEDRKGLSIFASSAERDLPYPDQGSNRRDDDAAQCGGSITGGSLGGLAAVPDQGAKPK